MKEAFSLFVVKYLQENSNFNQAGRTTVTVTTAARRGDARQEEKAKKLAGHKVKKQRKKELMQGIGKLTGISSHPSHFQKVLLPLNQKLPG